jgi:hypothetical protein
VRLDGGACATRADANGSSSDGCFCLGGFVVVVVVVVIFFLLLLFFFFRLYLTFALCQSILVIALCTDCSTDSIAQVAVSMLSQMHLSVD